MPSAILFFLSSQKDGDLSTSWTCTGDPREPSAEGYSLFECSLVFDLVYTRHIKQVKIGEKN